MHQHAIYFRITLGIARLLRDKVGQSIFNPLQPMENQRVPLMCDTLRDTWKTKGIIRATKEGPRGVERKAILRITHSHF